MIVDPAQPLGEGNSIFISISPRWDAGRAPRGQRAITISTHTRAAAWYALADDEQAFEERKQHYLEKLIDAALIALPNLKGHIRLAMPGTPLTFERFTRRVSGMVGGFPQKSLWSAWAPHASRDRAVWLVGDSVFPGQSTAGCHARRAARRPRNRTGDTGGPTASSGGEGRNADRVRQSVQESQGRSNTLIGLYFLHNNKIINYDKSYTNT